MPPRHALTALLTAAATLAVPSVASAATITVDDGGDALAADGRCTLREAVLSINGATGVGGCVAGTGADTIVIAVAKVTLARAGAGEDAAATGDLDVTGTATIRPGGGVASATIDAAGLDRALDVTVAGTLTLEDATVTGGRTPNGANGASPAQAGADGEGGGGLRNAGRLTLRRVTVTGNATGHGGAGMARSGDDAATIFGGPGGHGGDGGGIASSGALTVEGGVIAANATGAGGAGASANGGHETGSLNGADTIAGFGGRGGDGGAIAIDADTATVTGARITDNTTGDGGPGADAHGGAGTTSTSGTAGAGGDGRGGGGGDGGAGGAIAVHGTARATIARSLIATNHTGDGAAPGPGYGGGGGNGDVAGVGTGIGGEGGTGVGGAGGSGGDGGAIAAGPDYGQPQVRLEADTIVQNTTGGGVDGALGVGAPGGRGGPGRPGGKGGTTGGGSGGSGGLGAVSSFGNATVTASGLTVTANAASTVAGALGPSTPGAGGGGTPPGADGSHVVGPAAGGPGVGAFWTWAKLELEGSVVAANTPDQCSRTMGALVTGAGNITFPAEAASCPGATTADPKLRPLGDYGGATPTMALLPGSPALDAAGATCAGEADQRGVPRPAGGACDAGAYEAATPGMTASATSDGVINGTVDARRGATTVHVEYGPAAARNLRTAAVAVPAGTAAGAPVRFALSGLAPGTTYHYILVGANLDGTATTADATFTTPGQGAGGGGAGGRNGSPALKAPILSQLKVTPKSFKKGRKATISWTDSAAARVTFTVARKASGVRKGKACVAKPKSGKATKKKPRRCTRWVPRKGSFTHADRAGKNTMSWNGRVAGKALAVGGYRLTATPKVGDVRGKAVTTAFAVKRR